MWETVVSFHSEDIIIMMIMMCDELTVKFINNITEIIYHDC